ncbi:MAG TPA: FecR domain-containing protein [Vicinamibacterales bacterium]|jgi:hypothetical protein|nr:FecR domain-containing protein [Vicinamibacterales bacterium]
MPSPVWRPRAMALCCLWLAAMAPQVKAQSPGAGRVKVVAGTATIVREGQATPAVVGALVHETDVLRTGGDGQLAIMLKDESRLSMGPNSEVTVATFTYAPSEGRMGLVLRMARGVFSYVSGRIAKLMPEAVRLETPTSIVGVRGTHALVKVDAP